MKKILIGLNLIYDMEQSDLSFIIARIRQIAPWMNIPHRECSHESVKWRESIYYRRNRIHRF